ncbi:hypothetical protein Patl1_26685 [Pistacia atlantica]|uniref:Uncharacterized protein n=1 Tax=Pistacia atlantica TaxID=434234 RepID=A0ACC1B385_9ROSI|nr:hypothetical protein Patl1_26685 [Pistacia atlantica]
MEEKEDLKSVLPYLPLMVRSSTLFWPSKVVEALKSMVKGPEHSRVNSGEVLSVAICDIRSSLSLFEPLAPFALDGYALFFDDLISREESTKWFGEVVPALANFLLKLPSLLESHYQNADDFLGKYGIKTGLRILGPQEAGIVFLSQELIGAFLACSFFCLFPVTNRGANHLPTINFDELFAYTIILYSSLIPMLTLGANLPCPSALLRLTSLGSIEDHSTDALQVDFANKYIGGGALHRGCVQEEIRFMINPELIAGMLFLPSMADNEAIEIVGAERFSDYNGYASSFRFSGDHVDKRNVDVFRRRKTRIIAIDALCWPGMKQYALKYLLPVTPRIHMTNYLENTCQFHWKPQIGQNIQSKLLICSVMLLSDYILHTSSSSKDFLFFLWFYAVYFLPLLVKYYYLLQLVSFDRETNKALCGFIDQSKFGQYERLFPDMGPHEAKDNDNISRNNFSLHEASSTGVETNEGISVNLMLGNSDQKSCQFLRHKDSPGIVTGNWGCGAFGGDPELKAIIQWLAASQVTQWILSHEWTVGDLWNMMVEYSLQRLKGQTNLGFFTWLLPSLTSH